MYGAVYMTPLSLDNDDDMPPLSPLPPLIDQSIPITPTPHIAHRYADVLVHRLLIDSLTKEQQGGEVKSQCSLDVEALQEQARVCNEKKQAAKNAQEASDR
jgi:hypothetical protein